MTLISLSLSDTVLHCMCNYSCHFSRNTFGIVVELKDIFSRSNKSFALLKLSDHLKFSPYLTIVIMVMLILDNS